CRGGAQLLRAPPAPCDVPLGHRARARAGQAFAPCRFMTIRIERYMTQSPHTIGRDQTLAAAHRVMREHGIRHLPVLEGGKLVGIVSQRDLHLLETLDDVDPEQVEVSEAMTQDVYAVGPRTA